MQAGRLIAGPRDGEMVWTLGSTPPDRIDDYRLVAPSGGETVYVWDPPEQEESYRGADADDHGEPT